MTVARIEVGPRPQQRDARGERVLHRIHEHLGIAVEAVQVLDVYTLDMALTPQQLQTAAQELFSDPVTQQVSIDSPLACNYRFDWLVDVGLRPGVTDNEGRTAREALQLMLERPLDPEEAVYTGVQYVITGGTRQQVEQLAKDLLANELIQRWRLFTASEVAHSGVPVEVPRVTSDALPEVRRVDLSGSNDELMAISQQGMLALSLPEMQAIAAYAEDFQRLPARQVQGLEAQLTDVELEALAQTWSEHCKHKIFNARIRYEDEHGQVQIIDGLFRNYIKAATDAVRQAQGDNDTCLSVFKDNAGVITFTDHWNLVFKVETHNSPSALDPYGGALTGIVGVNRDSFGTGLGARLIANTDVFCFASPFYDQPLPQRLLHPRRILDGVVEGIEHGGNKSGIPTVNGSIVFDDRFVGKPLVYCGTAALMPRYVNGRPAHEKQAQPEDRIVMVGGRIGKDGIHGATFSSEELHAGSPVTAVQIGDPITQKRMFDFLLQARDQGLYNAITDNGAGGLSSSVGEMAEDTHGCELHLDRAPLKYSGLQPWEILISEAQERMTLAVPPDKLEAFLALARHLGVEATDLGRFTSSGYFHCLYDGHTVAYLEMDFLHDGLPQMEIPAKWQPPQHPEPQLPRRPNYTGDLKALLGRLNICSKESIVRRYDHEVQAATVSKPFVGAVEDGPADAAVLRPLADSFAGAVLAHGICPRYSDIDTYAMMANAIDEALRNYVAVGGAMEHVAGLDNFCWCDPVASDKTPDGAYKAAQLVRANQGLYDYCVAYGVPLISGKDSMKNDYHIGDRKISIPPTVLFSVIGKIMDVRRLVTMDAKQPGDKVYLLGDTRGEMGGSEYLAWQGALGNSVPQVDAPALWRQYQALNRAQAQGFVASCHDLSEGGLAVALAETAFAGGLGLTIDLARVPTPSSLTVPELLFSESAGRHLVTVPEKYSQAWEALTEGLPCSCIGSVEAQPRLQVAAPEGGVCIEETLATLKAAWQTPLKGV